MEGYLQNIPKEAGEVGISKVLMVRHEVIHLKHILTEVFHRKSVDIERILEPLNMTLFQYMEYMTQRLREIHKISRNFTPNPNELLARDFKSFFPYLETTSTFDPVIVLDFDGVVTSKRFKSLYKLCIERHKTIICSANPEINNTRLDKLGLEYPDAIFSNKGKRKKLRKLLDINSRNHFTFYVDDEVEYLKTAWLFGLKTYHYNQGKIKIYSLNSK